jgi:hypothetical protein
MIEKFLTLLVYLYIFVCLSIDSVNAAEFYNLEFEIPESITGNSKPKPKIKISLTRANGPDGLGTWGTCAQDPKLGQNDGFHIYVVANFYSLQKKEDRAKISFVWYRTGKTPVTYNHIIDLSKGRLTLESGIKVNINKN